MSVLGRMQENAISMTAQKPLVANFDLSNSGLNANPERIGAKIGGALEQSAQGLEAARDARQALAEQLGPNVQNAPQEMAGKTPGAMSMLGTMAATAAVGVIAGPAAAALFSLGSTLKDVGQHLGTVTASVTNAAIDGGASSFESPISRSGKGKKGADAESSSYTDISGDTWGSNGYLVASASSGSTMAPVDPGLSRQAARTIDKLGEQDIRAQLEEFSVHEKALLNQAGTAARAAEQRLGIKGAAGALDMKNPNALFANNLDFINDPDWKIAANGAKGFSAPSFG